MVSCPVLTVPPPPPWYWGGGVGTRIRYTHCISTLCRLSTLPQYYKPPPHHRGGGNLYTTTIPQTTPTPQGGGGSFTTTPHGGGRGGGDRPTLHHIYTATPGLCPESQDLPEVSPVICSKPCAGLLFWHFENQGTLNHLKTLNPKTLTPETLKPETLNPKSLRIASVFQHCFEQSWIDRNDQWQEQSGRSCCGLTIQVGDEAKVGSTWWPQPNDWKVLEDPATRCF